MPMAPFDSRFPQVAGAEFRAIHIADDDGGLPDDSYLIIESYCDEPRCDCRRVFLNVVAASSGRLLATISFGWADRAFYRKWMHGMASDDLLREMQGPSLEAWAPQSELAASLLEVVSEVALDHEYVERLKRHYSMFREAVDAEHARAPSPARRAGASPASRNAPCPCGSGKKHKRCCGRRMTGPRTRPSPA